MLFWPRGTYTLDETVGVVLRGWFFSVFTMLSFGASWGACGAMSSAMRVSPVELAHKADATQQMVFQRVRRVKLTYIHNTWGGEMGGIFTFVEFAHRWISLALETQGVGGRV